MMACEEFEELAGAFALGALPEDEMRAAREHLASCDKPHSEVRELQAVAAGLAAAAPEMDPPPALKSRLMDTIRAESPPAAAVERGAGLLDRVRGWFRTGTAGYGLAGALAIVIAALVIWNVSLQGDDDGGGGQFVVELSGAAGRLTVLPEQNIAIMDVEALEPAPAGHVYQAWAVSGGAAASLGIVEVRDDGSVRQAMIFDEAGVDQIAVTVEPAPGVEQPTTDPVISAEL
jgi:anti-sigma-K factor RskA